MTLLNCTFHTPLHPLPLPFVLNSLEKLFANKSVCLSWQHASIHSRSHKHKHKHCYLHFILVPFISLSQRILNQSHAHTNFFISVCIKNFILFPFHSIIRKKVIAIKTNKSAQLFVEREKIQQNFVNRYTSTCILSFSHLANSLILFLSVVNIQKRENIKLYTLPSNAFYSCSSVFMSPTPFFHLTF